jgi:hypothetical protein
MTRSDDVHGLIRGRAVFYSGSNVMISSEVFTTEHGRFQIRDLDLIQHGVEPLPSVVRVGEVIGVLVPLVFFGVAVSTGSTIGWLAAVGVTLAVAGAFAFVSRWPRVHVLTAQYHGMRVTLLRSSDLREFGAVRRALIRAREWQSTGATQANTAVPPWTIHLNGPAVPSTPRQGRPAPAAPRPSDAPAPRPPDQPAPSAPPAAEVPVPPALIDDAIARYDELLLRVGPPPGWQMSEGQSR